MRKVIVAVGLFFVLSTASVAKAQTRGRFWISSGVGVGSFNGDGVEVGTGLTGYVGGGVHIKQILSLGVEGSIWRKKETFGTSKFTQTHSLGSAVLYFHRRTVGGPFFKGLFGWGHRNVEGSLGKRSESGKQFGLGLGYDFGLGDSFSLRSYLNGSLSDFTGIGTLWEVGVGVAWH